MTLIDRFEAFASDFEACAVDGKWERLRKHFVEDATYWNVGGPDPRVEGRSAIVDFLKNDFENNDRRFDSRKLQAVAEPTVSGNQLFRQWHCTYTLAGAPDLVVEGEARYRFEEGLIASLEEEITAESMERYTAWMREFGARLLGS